LTNYDFRAILNLQLVISPELEGLNPGLSRQTAGTSLNKKVVAGKQVKPSLATARDFLILGANTSEVQIKELL
jgi:hypothetical protein